ncbi:proline-rich protein [Ephemerocybe angulata]|uniref:Proline-rich protein n=1 Tax=Ephemerocybe angulata TaxID=980116 RepID=A0A8H6ICI5_9AGAR|nr:proline-rich protein [Tulosesus angulatus]
MGRALFSKSYSSSPAVRAEPQAVDDTICQKWSVWNNFDPDSEEFFKNAQDEKRVSSSEAVEPADTDSTSDGSSETTETSGSDAAASLMATGPDDPVVLIADAYPMLDTNEWERRPREASSAASVWLDHIAVTTTDVVGANDATSREEGGDDTEARSYRPNRPRSASAAPARITLSSSLFAQGRATGAQVEQVSTIPTAASMITALQAIAAGPATVNGPSSSSSSPSVQTVLPFLEAPATPQRRNVRGSTQTIVSPSPPPSVTPRYYSWQNHSIPAIPTSPTALRGNRDGPLTNPHARRSFVRIGSAQAPVLVTNSAN